MLRMRGGQPRLRIDGIQSPIGINRMVFFLESGPHQKNPVKGCPGVLLVNQHSPKGEILFRVFSASPVQPSVVRSGAEFFSETFFGSMAIFPFVRKNLGQFPHGRFLPEYDLIAMHSELGSDLIDRHVPRMAAKATLALKSG